MVSRRQLIGYGAAAVGAVITGVAATDAIGSAAAAPPPYTPWVAVWRKQTDVTVVRTEMTARQFDEEVAYQAREHRRGIVSLSSRLHPDHQLRYSAVFGPQAPGARLVRGVTAEVLVRMTQLFAAGGFGLAVLDATTVDGEPGRFSAVYTRAAAGTSLVVALSSSEFVKWHLDEKKVKRHPGTVVSHVADGQVRYSSFSRPGAREQDLMYLLTRDELTRRVNEHASHGVPTTAITGHRLSAQPVRFAFLSEVLEVAQRLTFHDNALSLAQTRAAMGAAGFQLAILSTNPT
jgi:hypothetical protein